MSLSSEAAAPVSAPGPEQTENGLLAGSSDALFWNRLGDLFGGREQRGASIELTLLAELQRTADASALAARVQSLALQSS